MSKTGIQQIAEFVQTAMARVIAPDLQIAHDFKHVDRVRHWALRIAQNEGHLPLKLVEATALLHDIGLAYIEADERGRHAQVGAEVAAWVLHEHNTRMGALSDAEIARIADAIRWHSSPSGGGALGALLRDADKLDALGAIGIMRAFTSKYAKPEYNPGCIKGETWNLTMTGFEARFAAGQGIGPHIIDQINFQISFYSDLHTETAKRLGKPLVDFMRAYVLQLEAEVKQEDHLPGS
jgi:uncharacterized protein